MTMAYTLEQLEALEGAVARGERRVTFADKTVEYRTVEELKEAMRLVRSGLAEQSAATLLRTALLRHRRTCRPRVHVVPVNGRAR